MNNHKINNCSLSIANYILTIAGFDPSSGAGLTSDIKTFDAFGLYGLSVCTGVTVQNDIEFKACDWVKTETILAQIETLFERFTINTVKIGIVENWVVLQQIVDKLLELNPEVKIILDPIIKATAGFEIQTVFERSRELDYIFSKCYIITPNYDEIKALYPEKDIEETIEHIASLTNIYLKGGHREDKKGWDELYHSKIVQVNIEPIAEKIFDKHGSGCVLSSTLASNLELGIPLEDAVVETKRYVEEFLNSNEGLLGTHNRNKNSESGSQNSLNKPNANYQHGINPNIINFN